MSTLTEQEMAPFTGEANAELNARPLQELVAEIAAWQQDFDTPDDLDWPTEDGRHPYNP